MQNIQVLFDMIGELARRRYGAAERAFATIGLNHTEARLLALLDREGGTAFQDVLSSQIVVDRTNAGRALKHLEAEGLIQRHKSGGDKRANLVEITLAGRTTASHVNRIRTEIASSFFGNLTDDDAGKILALLETTKEVTSDE